MTIFCAYVMPKNLSSPKPCATCHNILVLTMTNSWVPAQLSNWRTTRHLSLTAYSLQSHLPSHIWRQSPLCATRGYTMAWWQGSLFYMPSSINMDESRKLCGLDMQLRWRATRSWVWVMSLSSLDLNVCSILSGNVVEFRKTPFSSDTANWLYWKYLPSTNMASNYICAVAC